MRFFDRNVKGTTFNLHLLRIILKKCHHFAKSTVTTLELTERFELMVCGRKLQCIFSEFNDQIKAGLSVLKTRCVYVRMKLMVIMDEIPRALEYAVCHQPLVEEWIA
jgi:hypothetical protein